MMGKIKALRVGFIASSFDPTGRRQILITPIQRAKLRLVKVSSQSDDFADDTWMELSHKDSLLPKFQLATKHVPVNENVMHSWEKSTVFRVRRVMEGIITSERNKSVDLWRINWIIFE